jgi:transposase-like protein
MCPQKDRQPDDSPRPRELERYIASVAVAGRALRSINATVPLRVVDELLPEALHDTTQYANNRIECDHGRLKSRLRPMRGLRTDRTASVVIRGHAFIQNLRRGHYELGVEARHVRLRVAAAFDELAEAI